MNTLFCILFFLQSAPADLKHRERHPLAPSLPLLTKEETQQIDAVIERFIQYDIGKLKGAEGKKALSDFNRLGLEASFQLLDGLNRAADLEASCPAILIAKRLASIYSTTNDIELLTFARENIGAGVTAKRHLAALEDLKFYCQLRKAALYRLAVAQGGRAVNTMSLAELEKSAARERGPRLKAILLEAEKRPGVKAVEVLLQGTTNNDPAVAKLSQGLLAKSLEHQAPAVFKTLLQHESKEVRIAAAQTVGRKRLRFGTELISLLQERDVEVRQAAHRALVQLADGMDFGPDAVERWRTWWSRQD